MELKAQRWALRSSPEQAHCAGLREWAQRSAARGAASRVADGMALFFTFCDLRKLVLGCMYALASESRCILLKFRKSSLKFEEKIGLVEI